MGTARSFVTPVLALASVAAADAGEIEVHLLAHTVIKAEHPDLGTIGGLSGLIFHDHAAFETDTDTPGGERDRLVRTSVDGERRAAVEFISDSHDLPCAYTGTVALRRFARTLYTVRVELDEREPLHEYDAEELARLREADDFHTVPAGMLPRAADAEAIAHHHTDHDNGDRRGIRVIAFEQPHQISATLSWPRHHLGFMRSTLTIPEEIREHIRPNRGFEAVTITDRHVWAATESAITTDGPEATADTGTLCTLLRWPRPRWRGQPEDPDILHYRTDPKPPHIGPTFSLHSLTDFEALPDGRLLALERSLTLPAGYSAKIFIIDPDAPRETLPDGREVVHKQLLLDLATIRGEKNDAPRWLGNLEGMALGPSIADLTGDESEPGRLLLLVADDNFGTDIQRAGSQVIALRLVGMGNDQPGNQEKDRLEARPTGDR